MKYYKLVLNNEIIGIADSNSFIKFSPKTRSFLRANEETGEYVNWNGEFYRATWMRPIVFQIPYTSVQILNIEESEYEAFQQAFTTNETIIYERQEQEEEEQENTPFVDPIDVESVEYIRKAKLNEMSLACRHIIEAGFDLELRGETCHFSLDTQDQLNLISLSAMAQTQSMIPYHADGEMCIFYTAEEINEIVSTATAFKVYHTTYYNALKGYINALNTIEEISAITYGTQIPEEYQSDVLKALSV